MEQEDAILALAALAQSTRLEVFRLLVQHEPDGLLAGDIARSLGVPHNTMSSHLAILARARLVVSERQSRTVTYRANLTRVNEFVTFLLKDCCAGSPVVCRPVLAAITPCCAPERTDA